MPECMKLLMRQIVFFQKIREHSSGRCSINNASVTLNSKYGRYMERKKCVVPGEVSSAVETEYEAVVTTNGEKSAEAIVP